MTDRPRHLDDAGEPGSGSDKAPGQEQPVGRVVVFGDSDFASNQFFNAGANSLLFLNSLNWASQEESLINLTPKVPTTRALNIVGGFTMNLIFFLTVVVMPGTVLLIGLLVWVVRRRHT